ncbi:MAG: C10 family peptidase [Deltaproteobacteria bacterium]|nr:C10 family peptidase [Deltaproteobacteria bacterium]
MRAMQFTFVLAIVALFAGLAQATIVSKEEVERVARVWLANSNPQSAIQSSLELRGEDGSILGRVFEISPKGWVSVSCIRELAPIVAYSLEDNTFIHENIDGSIGTMLQNTLQECVEPFMREFGSLEYRPQGSVVEQYRHNYILWDSLLLNRETRVDGLMNAMLTTRWNQTWPYNAYCPIIDDEYTMAGCVAIAMAQIMKYHEFPIRGSLSTLGFRYIAPCCGLITIYNHDEYDWPNMPNIIHELSPQIEIDAVAELVYEVGVSCLMDYGVDASGAWEDRVPIALVDHYGYRDQVQHVLRESYSDIEWFEFIQNELNHTRPIFYVFYSSADTRHAMVADGWKVETIGGETNRWVHLNYGWGGANQRFFLLNEISVHRPEVDEIYCNIEPPEGWQRINPLNLISPTCAAWGDYDNDGYPDLFLGGNYWTYPPFQNTLFHNDGGSNLSLGGTIPRDVYGAAWGDYDNDGNLDLMVVGIGAGLFHNQGGGQFVEMSNDLGIPQNVGYSSVCWGDYNSDGLIDLLISTTQIGISVRILRNNGNSTPKFAETTPQILRGLGKVGSALWVDVDNDNILDLSLFGVGDNYELETLLFRGLGGGAYSDVTATSGVTVVSQTGSWGDIDGDGDLDLYIAGIGGGNLYRNNGNFTFSDISSSDMDDVASLLSRSGIFGDVDNDGDLDLYVTSTMLFGDCENVLFLNDGTGSMIRSLRDQDIRGNSPGGSSEVAAWADIDLDGDIDLVCDGWKDEHPLGWVYCYIMRNEGHLFGHGLNVQLQGTLSNAQGIGSVVTIGEGVGAQTRVLEGSSTGQCQSWLVPHFGIPTVGTPRISVAWPSGSNSIRPEALNETSFMSIAEISVVGVAEDVAANRMNKVRTYPNPCNGKAIILCEIPSGGYLEVDLYDVSGAHLAQLYSRSVLPGNVEVPIIFGNHERGELPSGIYFARVAIDGEYSYQKISYVK